MRLKIARGVARGLAYIHEKKHVHGNIKPSNILLNSEMEPVIGDFGLDRLVSTNIRFSNNTSYKESNSSSRLFGSQKSTTHQDQHATTSSSPYAPAGSSGASMSLYQAPELLKTLKPSPKWDVYSFGIVLLELLTGRVLSERELDQYGTANSASEEKLRVLRMADVTVRGDVESREDAMLACFKLGFRCASFVPQKRHSMKEAAQILEKIIPC